MIELLIIIAVIGILALISIPNFTLVREDAHLVSVKKEMKSVQKAMELYFIDNSHYPYGFGVTLQVLVNNNLISKPGIIDFQKV